MHILTDNNWTSFYRIVNYSRAFISNKIRGSNSYEYPTFIETIKRCAETDLVDVRANICYQNYEKLILSGSNSLELLIDIALENWLKRL